MTKENPGRPRNISYDQILELRKRGLSLSQIALRLNCSVSTVEYAIKQGKKK
jgi:DNA-binding CsgD family transcriptional regulator